MHRWEDKWVRRKGWAVFHWASILWAWINSKWSENLDDEKKMATTDKHIYWFSHFFHNQIPTHMLLWMRLRHNHTYSRRSMIFYIDVSKNSCTLIDDWNSLVCFIFIEKKYLCWNLEMVPKYFISLYYHLTPHKK